MAQELCPRTIHWEQDGFRLILTRLPDDEAQDDRAWYRLQLYDFDYTRSDGEPSTQPMFVWDRANGRVMGSPFMIVSGVNDTPHRMRKWLIINAIGFLSLQRGDTDHDYFDEYTPEQLAWTKSGRAEYLASLGYSLEESIAD